MSTKQFSNYEDLLTFTRASKGHALRPVSYGDELVTNGTFDSDLSGWNNDSIFLLDTFELDSGRLHIENTAGTTQAAYTDDNISLVAGKIYRFTAELEKVGGSDNWEIDIRTQGTGTILYSLTTTATTETLQVIFVATQTENTAIQITTRNTFEGYIDNVSVKEVLFDQPDGTLTLFEHPVNVPRVEWDSAGNRLGLLVEEARTNSLTYSEDFSEWLSATVAISKDSIGPDGIENSATTLTDDNASVFESVRENATISANTDTHTVSVFIKKDENETRFPEIQINLAGGTEQTQAVALNTKTGATNIRSGTGSVNVQDAGDWWRISTSATNNGTNTQLRFYIFPALTTTLDGSISTSVTGSIVAYGAQIELNASFPTSYIKTTGATATRSADVASIPVADFGFNADAGSLLVSYDTKGSNGTSYPRPAEINDGTSSNRIAFWINPSNNVGLSVSDGGVNQGTVYNGGTLSTDTAIKSAASYKLNDLAHSTNGTTAGTDTSATIPTVTTLRIGSQTSAQELNGHIKSIQYYPRRLTNAQLQALTEPRSTPTLSLTFDGLESSYTENYIHG